MTWNTAIGPRTLSGAEAYLVGQTAWQLTDSIREGLSIDSPLQFDIVLFDALTWQQQIVMLDRVLAPLLDADIDPPVPTALMDATIAAIYAQLVVFIETEIDMERTSDAAEEGDTDGRQEIVNALVECAYEGDCPDAECAVIDTWELLIEALRDRVLADEDYQMDGLTLDLPPEKSREFKRTLGISGDYFIDVPPDATTEDARNAWGNIIERITGERPNVSCFP